MPCQSLSNFCDFSSTKSMGLVTVSILVHVDMRGGHMTKWQYVTNRGEKAWDIFAFN